MFSSISVFCGSQNGKNSMYAEHAKALGMLLGQNNIQLVYGGGKNGLMGIVADAVLQNGGKVVGIITSLLNEKEHQHNELTTLHVVETMHERKKIMYELSDAAVILPGGFGTLDELFEIITWNQLNIHNKQIFLINSNGYFDCLIEHLKKMQAEGFLYSDWTKMVFIIQDPLTLPFLKDADKYQSHRE